MLYDHRNAVSRRPYKLGSNDVIALIDSCGHDYIVLPGLNISVFKVRKPSDNAISELRTLSPLELREGLVGYGTGVRREPGILRNTLIDLRVLNIAQPL